MEYSRFTALSVATVQHNKSTIGVRVPSLFWISFPFRLPQCIKQSSLHSRFSLLIYFRHSINSIYVNPNLPVHPTPTSPLGVHMFDLYICDSVSALQRSSLIPFGFENDNPPQPHSNSGILFIAHLHQDNTGFTGLHIMSNYQTPSRILDSRNTHIK